MFECGCDDDCDVCSNRSMYYSVHFVLFEHSPNSGWKGAIIIIQPSQEQDRNDLVDLLRGQFASALVHIDVALLQDQVAETPPDPLDLRDGVHHLS